MGYCGYVIDPHFCQKEIFWPTKDSNDVFYRQCRRNPQEGSIYCWQHQPERMEESRQAMIKRLEKAIRKQSEGGKLT